MVSSMPIIIAVVLIRYIRQKCLQEASQFVLATSLFFGKFYSFIRSNQLSCARPAKTSMSAISSFPSAALIHLWVLDSSGGGGGSLAFASLASAVAIAIALARLWARQKPYVKSSLIVYTPNAVKVQRLSLTFHA